MSAVIKKAKADLNQALENIEKAEKETIKIIHCHRKAKNTLEELHEKLPQVLASIALGDDNLKKELEMIERDIRDNERTLHYTKLTMQGLEAFTKVNQRNIREPRRILKLAERYEEIKTQFSKEYSSVDERDLRFLANKLDMVNDLEDFLSSLPITA